MYLILLHMALAAPKKKKTVTLQNPDMSADLFAELNGDYRFTFRDAVTGKAISGVKITFLEKSELTDSEGIVSFPQREDVPMKEHVVYAYASKSGYIDAKIPITFMAGTIWLNNFSLSPAFVEEKYRIVLDWGKSPRDLDAHLVKTSNDSEVYHISYRDMKSFEDKAFLDKDDMDGYGPETITINQLKNTYEYTYFVHDYSNKSQNGSNSLSKSRAHISVYNESGLIHSIYAPENKKGTKWNVFTITDGVLEITNTID